MPPLPPGFQYIEEKYILSEGLLQPDSGFLEVCDCPGECDTAADCACQSMADLDMHGDRTFAYDSKVRR